jgi:AcrR family transcriptional regulator
VTEPVTDRRRTRAGRRAAARTRLLEVVERRLRNGETFTDIKVGEIVAEAGLSRTTFYVYFEDKADLLRSWYADVSATITTAARAWWALGATADRGDLRAALAGIVAAYRPHPELMAATHEAIGYDHDIRQAVDEAMASYIAGLAAHIERGQTGGFVDPSLPPHETAYWLQWMAERGLHRMVRAESARIDSLLDAYTLIIWNVLYAPARRSE